MPSPLAFGKGETLPLSPHSVPREGALLRSGQTRERQKQPQPALHIKKTARKRADLEISLYERD
jgi:hypothetical protein